MNLLFRLLGTDVPENTTLQSAELSFRGLLPVWLSVFILLALVALVIYLYRLEKGDFGWPRRVAMIALRVALLALVLFLLFRPVLLTEYEGQKPRQIAFLLDNSQSMRQHDRRLTPMDKMRVAMAKGLTPLKKATTPVSAGNVPQETPIDPSRADMVRWLLEQRELKLIPKLETRGPVRLFLFGNNLHGTGEEAGKRGTLAERLLEDFKADEIKTNLADAVIELLERKDSALPAAIVAVTDGQDNASKFTLQEAALECARREVPLYIYGVGSSEGGSLQLIDVGIPDTIFVQDAITVPLRYRAQGIKKGTLVATFSLGGKIIAKREIQAVSAEDVRDNVNLVVPKGKGKDENLDLVTTLELKGNKAFKDTLTKPVHVVDRKIRVLYVEHSARFVYQFLMAALMRDRRVEPSFLLVNADPKVSKSGPPFLPSFPPTREKFLGGEYNVIILGDVASGYLGKEHMEWIREFVQNRGGLIVIAGRQYMPASYVGTPLADVFPVEFESRKFAFDVDTRTQEFPTELTEVGKRSDMLSLADTPEDSLREWSKLPGFHWQYPLAKLKPGSVSLLENPRAKMGDQPMPLLAAHHYGKGQVLFLGSDETWRWRFNEADKITNRFWGQIVYQLGLPSLLGQSSKRVQVALERAQAILNVPGSLFVRMLDKDFNPRKDAKIEATLEYLDAKPGQEKTRTLTLVPIPGQDGEYRAPLAHDQPGRYEVRINNPETNVFPFRVELPAKHELQENGLAEVALSEMAELSGGKFYREEDLNEMASDIQPKMTAFTRRQEVVLWGPLALILFVMLITGEWLLRKFSNLA